MSGFVKNLCSPEHVGNDDIFEPSWFERFKSGVSRFHCKKDYDGMLQFVEREVSAMREAAHDLVMRDPLTGLLNRRGFWEAVSHLLAELERGHNKRVSDDERRRRPTGDRRAPLLPLALVYCDIDDFKRINDEVSHATGDAVLQFIGAKLRTNFRSNDCCARIGGDEFLVLMREIESSDAERKFADLNEELSRYVIKNEEGNVTDIPVRVTFSEPIEVKSSADLVHAVEEAFHRADKGLGKRKRSKKSSL